MTSKSHGESERAVSEARYVAAIGCQQPCRFKDVPQTTQPRICDCLRSPNEPNQSSEITAQQMDGC